MTTETWVAVLGVSLPVLGLIFVYNALVKKDKFAEEAWHGIDVQLKRRHDLIPALVETVKGYARHETQTLERVIALRNATGTSSSVCEQAKDDMQMGRMLKSLFALAENYPALKADATFLELQSNLRETEDALQDARRYYNATVRDYNTLACVFPSNLVAGLFGFKAREFFTIDNAAERKPVSIDFS